MNTTRAPVFASVKLHWGLFYKCALDAEERFNAGRTPRGMIQKAEKSHFPR
jgi:hypothetical protein